MIFLVIFLPSPMPDVELRFGTMGFGYADWDGVFYPPAVKGPGRLRRYAAEFDAVELDSTFHAIPAAAHVRKWAAVTPDAFRFTAKMPRSVTHAIDRPLNSAESLREAFVFIETMRLLGEKLAAVLVQFPPSFGPGRFGELAAFLGGLPGDARYAIELRNDAWWHPATADLFKKHNAAWVVADEVPEAEGRLPPDDPAATYRPRRAIRTADWFYLRWIGVHEQFGKDARKDCQRFDPAPRLAAWAEKIGRLADSGKVRQIYGFFNNDYSGHSPENVRALRRLTGQPAKPVAPASLFGP